MAGPRKANAARKQRLMQKLRAIVKAPSPYAVAGVEQKKPNSAPVSRR